METNINYTLVGAFVIALISVIVFSIIWLSSGFSLQQYTTYMTYMQESVSGLSIDSPVEFNGVNVGNVKDVELNHKNPQLVEVILSIKSNTPLTQGTIATLKSKGVTGITYISLNDSSSDLRPLVKQKGQPYPVIKAGPSLFTRLDTALNQVSADLHQVTQAIKETLDKQNLDSLKQILVNLQNVTNTLSANSEKMDTIITNTAKASEQFGPLIQSGVRSMGALSGAMTTLQSQTLPQTYQLLANLNNVTRNLNEVSTQLKNNPSILIRGGGQPPLGPGEVK